MNISTITNSLQITSNDCATNIFLTNYNNMVVMLTYLQNYTSSSVDLVTSVSSNTLTINAHSRQYLDGSTRSMPAGTITLTANTFVGFDNNVYFTSTTKPTGKSLVIGYYDGSTFTKYQVGNM